MSRQCRVIGEKRTPRLRVSTSEDDPKRTGELLIRRMQFEGSLQRFLVGGEPPGYRRSSRLCLTLAPLCAPWKASDRGLNGLRHIEI
jgi:hypothetical protein